MIQTGNSQNKEIQEDLTNNQRYANSNDKTQFFRLKDSFSLTDKMV